MFKLGTVTALVAGTLFAQAAAPAADSAAQNGHRLGIGLQSRRIIRELNLTIAQKQQARTIFRQARQTAQPVRQQLEQNRQMLEDAVKSGKTGAEIQQLATHQGSLLGQITAIRSEALSQVFNLLTPDQRIQAGQLMR